MRRIRRRLFLSPDGRALQKGPCCHGSGHSRPVIDGQGASVYLCEFLNEKSVRDLKKLEDTLDTDELEVKENVDETNKLDDTQELEDTKNVDIEDTFETDELEITKEVKKKDKDPTLISDTDILKHNNDKRYKLFNPKEIIVNPNNNFNFFHQTFTKEPKYCLFIEYT